MAGKINKIGVYKDYIYVIVDMNLGFENWRNGYVKLKDDSKFLNKEYDEYPLYNIECNGGITFKDTDISLFGEGTYIGFDTMHYFDDENSRKIENIEKNCKSIIEQLILLENED